MSIFSEWLKNLREKSGLSQSQLASRLNIAKSTLATYELGEREPNFDTVTRIAQFFAYVLIQRRRENSKLREGDIKWMNLRVVLKK